MALEFLELDVLQGVVNEDEIEEDDQIESEHDVQVVVEARLGSAGLTDAQAAAVAVVEARWPVSSRTPLTGGKEALGVVEQETGAVASGTWQVVDNERLQALGRRC